jgi:ribosomal protein S18 acetylase RimI-like enzyme
VTGTRLAPLEPGTFRTALPDLLEVYLAAMRYPPGTGEARAPLWADHSRRDGFRCVAAVDEDGSVAGLAYGYRGRPGQWWYSEVARGLEGDPQGWLADYFELTELHVRPDRQGVGLGESLLRSLLGPVTTESVLLSTPEGENRAWRLYRRVGFRDVLRDFLFTGDGRRFGVLGRALPLDAQVGPPVGPAAS